MRVSSTKYLAILALAGCGWASSTWAQDPEPIIEDRPPEVENSASASANVEPVVDAPSRVARLSYMDGDVSMAPAGGEEWADAVLNRPLTTGDRVWVDRGGRAELQVGSASIHLDQQTGFSFDALDDDALRMHVTDGAMTIRVRRKAESEAIEVSTPNGVVKLQHPGEYHIEVDAAGDRTIVKSRSGESVVLGGSRSYTVRANQEGVFSGTGGELVSDMRPIGSRTAFEGWANDRDRRDETAVSSRYVSRDVIGYEDLDQYGEWANEPEYGYVWRPRYVAAGWAPYSYGRWAWISPWGWTWVDSAPWGFAPYHYGRWAHVRNRWCWVPGPRHLRPIYAPALVGWVGSPSLSVSVSFGPRVGWFPLAPREVWVPGYRCSPRYIRGVNVSNTIIVNNTYIDNIYYGRNVRYNYRNRGLAGAVTAVERDLFVRGRPVHDHMIRVDNREMRQWRDDARPPALAPTRDSIRAGQQRDVRSLPQRDRFDRSVGGAVSRVAFDTERQAIERNGGRPVDRSHLFTPPKERSAADPRIARYASGGPGKAPSTEAQPGRNLPDRGQPNGRLRNEREGRDSATRGNGNSPPVGNALRGNGDSQQPGVIRGNDRNGSDRSSGDRRFSDRPTWARGRDRDTAGGAAPGGGADVNRDRGRSSGGQAQPAPIQTMPARETGGQQADQNRSDQNRATPERSNRSDIIREWRSRANDSQGSAPAATPQRSDRPPQGSSGTSSRRDDGSNEARESRWNGGAPRVSQPEPRQYSPPPQPRVERSVPKESYERRTYTQPERSEPRSQPSPQPRHEQPSRSSDSTPQASPPPSRSEGSASDRGNSGGGGERRSIGRPERREQMR